ncbi:hypothetical protein PR048_012735 [Dryococelus australis]|uniref:Uncharacterized protein n=1 Tax=Dryococelus australis TaxID=614101 RepID=A0ABQ9HQZ1_9NEOP|nr:hypothetical protein PR048_012735 [Dryococelus australis]
MHEHFLHPTSELARVISSADAYGFIFCSEPEVISNKEVCPLTVIGVASALSGGSLRGEMRKGSCVLAFHVEWGEMHIVCHACGTYAVRSVRLRHVQVLSRCESSILELIHFSSPGHMTSLLVTSLASCFLLLHRREGTYKLHRHLNTPAHIHGGHCLSPRDSGHEGPLRRIAVPPPYRNFQQPRNYYCHGGTTPIMEHESKEVTVNRSFCTRAIGNYCDKWTSILVHFSCFYGKFSLFSSCLFYQIPGCFVDVFRKGPRWLSEEHACLPPRRTGPNTQPGHRIFPSGNRAGRCRWSAGLLEDLPLPPLLHAGAAPYSLPSPSSALKISLRQNNFPRKDPRLISLRPTDSTPLPDLELAASLATSPPGARSQVAPLFALQADLSTDCWGLQDSIVINMDINAEALLLVFLVGVSTRAAGLQLPSPHSQQKSFKLGKHIEWKFVHVVKYFEFLILEAVHIYRLRHLDTQRGMASGLPANLDNCDLLSISPDAGSHHACGQALWGMTHLYTPPLQTDLLFASLAPLLLGKPVNHWQW